MEARPTPSDTARMILELFKHHGIRPGEVLMVQVLIGFSVNNGLTNKELADGLRHGSEQGWWEDNGRGSFRLEGKGFWVL